MADPTDSMDDGDEIERLVRRFYPLIIESAFGDASLAGIPVAFDLDNPFVQTVIDRLAEQVRNVAETTKEEIRALVAKQAGEGWSIEQLQKAIRERGQIASRTRALMIARTETASAYSMGSIAAYKASGVVDRIEWLIGPDPCPECEPLNGKIVAIDDEFAPGVMHPPAHPHCTCALAPVVE